MVFGRGACVPVGAADRGVQGTPTVFVDDTMLDDLSIETLTAAIDTAE
jgi:protein-disulfide isomerase